MITQLPTEITSPDDPPVLTEHHIVYDRTTTSYAYPRHKTPYLLLANFLGSGHYELNGKAIEASDKRFYFLNKNDDLAIRFHQSNRLETLFILFEEAFVHDTFEMLSAPPRSLLDCPTDRNHQEVIIPSVPFALSTGFLSLIQPLLQDQLSREESREYYFQLLAAFYWMNQESTRNIQSIEATKKSTREELYQRLFIAKEFIHDHLREKITLEQMARQACLNKYHFLVTFREAFNVTPHKYVTEQRLQEAYRMLKQGQSSVSDTCYTSGFDSLGSFSNLFKKRFRLSPSALLKSA